jgi:DNA-directed RNA polymerase specialized sigma subunit
MTNPNREALILHHIEDTKAVVHKFLRSHPAREYLRDDMLAHAALRVVQVVDAFLAGKIPNLKACCRQAVVFGNWDAIRTENVIQSPRNCSAERDLQYEMNAHPNRHERNNETAMIEMVLEHCTSDEERTIMRLILAGTHIRKVAATLGTSILKVKKIKKAIWNKLESQVE